MIRVTLRGLAGRKLRSALTAFAIVLGVAMVSGTYVLTDTIDKAFAGLFESTYADTDARVTGKAADVDFQGEGAARPSVPARLLEEVRTVPGVALAAGTVVDDDVRLLDKHGAVIASGDAPTLAFGIDTRPELARFNPTQLVEGRWPAGGGEVVVDAATARREGYRLGEAIGAAAQGPVERFRIVGLARYGGIDSIGGASFTVFDLAAAQRFLGKEGRLDEIDVAGRSGVSPARLARSLHTALPATVAVQTSAEAAREETDENTAFTDYFRYFLLVFGGIALFVGAFVIFNTLSITIAQRTRELATLRTIGASRRQVLGSVLTESLAIGLVAALAGLAAGVALAAGLKALFAAFGVDLPDTGIVVARRTVVVALAIGTVVTLVAGFAPAVRATRVPPIAAVREGAELPPSWLSRSASALGGVTTALGLVVMAFALFSHAGIWTRLIATAGGVLTLFLGVALLSPRLVSPLASLIGRAGRRIGGVAGALAEQNARRNPGRTAATAAALMIGLALVTLVAVLAAGMKVSNRAAIEEQLAADYLVTAADNYSPFPAAAGEAVRTAAPAELVTSIRAGLAKAAGSNGYLTGIDPRAIGRVWRFRWRDGSEQELGGNGAIVTASFAKDKGLAVGDAFPLLTEGGKRVRLEVRGIYEPPRFWSMLGNVSVATATFDRLYERPQNQLTLVNAAAGAKGSLEAALAAFPDTKVQTREQWIVQQNRDFDKFLAFLYVLLALSVVVSLLGMVNTLVLSVFERTRELGLLRAVGMTRRQTGRMVRHESVITALIGATLGLPLGLFLALLVTEALSQFDVRLSLPVVQIAVFALVAIAAGILAAVLPARRASRLSVLAALQYE